MWCVVVLFMCVCGFFFNGGKEIVGQCEQAGVETTAVPGCDGLGWSLSHISSLE